MKVGIFGGSFDPLHSGHLFIIEKASQMFDKILVVPTTIRYYKCNKNMFSFNERFEAIKEKTKEYKNVEVLDIERDVGSSWRFVDTVSHIYDKNSENEYTIIMGSDSFQNFKTWDNYEKILKYASICVFTREGYTDNYPDIEHSVVEMTNNASSTKIRENLKKLMEEDEFELFLCDIGWDKND